MPVNRRQILCLALGAGASLGVGATAWLRRRTGEPLSDPAQPSGLRAATRTSRALGSDVSMTAVHRDERVAAAAINEAFDELKTVESLMSIYRPDSQLSQLNHHKQLDDPHPYLLEVLRTATVLARRSGGAFDVTVQPLWRLYAQADEQGRLPNEDEIAEARARVDWRSLNITPRQIRLANPDCEITLNGIAQGFAADRALAALKRRGVEHALVNTGEIGALGENTERAAWRVGIQHPRLQDAFISLALLKNRCLATSGDYATQFGGGYEYNHLFDPGTGRSPEQLAAVSVAAHSATEADALSTAVFVMGPEKGMALIRETRGADALLILKSGRVLSTDGFPLEEKEEGRA